MMDRFRKRKCFADTELEQLASQSLNQTTTINSKLIKKQECVEMKDSIPSQIKQPNFQFTNTNYVMDNFAFNNYFSQLANLTKVNIWYLQASLNGQNSLSHDLFNANFNCLNLNHINSMTFTDFSSENSPSPNEFTTYIGVDDECTKSNLDLNETENAKKMEEFKLDCEKNLTKEKYSGKAKSFSVDSLLGVVK